MEIVIRCYHKLIKHCRNIIFFIRLLFYYMDNTDYYTNLKNQIKSYLRFGHHGDKTVVDVEKIFFSMQLPDDINVLEIPSIETKLAKLHAKASFELSMAICSLNLAQEMYSEAYNIVMEEIKNSFKAKGTREPGADKLKDLTIASLDKKFILQKLYSENAVTIMKQALEHLDFIGWRLKNIVAARSIDARLEKGNL